MTVFLAELIGTCVLILLGDGVVGNVALAKSKGENGGWIVVALGWGIAVFTGVYIAAEMGSDAHINPAVTIAMAIIGNVDWSMVPVYISGQMIGAALGALLVWLTYRPHFEVTDNTDAKLAVFCTGPAIRNTTSNLISEVIGTVMLVFGVFYIAGAEVGDQSASLGALDALPVALLVLGIGLSLGGPTGYAINPARDLSPRIMHYLLPIPRKGSSDWSYAWIPVVGPILGGIVAAGLFILLS